MKVGPYIGLIILVVVFGSALLGMLIRRKLPESHLSDETQSVVRLTMGVVGTLTAMVLGLLVATASTMFNSRNQEITQFATKEIQLARLLQRYGPEAAGERDLLRLYESLKLQDLSPQGKAQPTLENPRTHILFEELQDRLAAMEVHSSQQRWLLSQALALTSDMVETRWLLIEQDVLGIPVPVLLVVLFWLCMLFTSFGLFAPTNVTVTVALFSCALAVAGAIQTTLDLSRPFEGVIRVSEQPLRHAVEVINQVSNLP
jgi:hypothetical protein